MSHVGERLYEETCDLLGTPVHLVVEKVEQCIENAKTPIAETRLAVALDEFFQHLSQKRESS